MEGDKKNENEKKVLVVAPRDPGPTRPRLSPHHTKSKPNNKTNHRDFNWKGLPEHNAYSVATVAP